MKALSQIHLTTAELPDALEFRVEREAGWFELALSAVITIFAVWLFWKTGSLFPRIIAVLAAAAAVVTLWANWLHGKVTRLVVNAEEIVADGNLDRILATTVRIPAGELKSLRWDSGGEDGTPGLYANRGWNSTLLLPHITQQHATTICNAIENRFPEICVGDADPASFLFGSGSELTTLNLNDPPDENSRTER